MEPCCANLENRTEPEMVEGHDNLSLTRCKQCGRRHFELEVEPGMIGVQGGSL